MTANYLDFDCADCGAKAGEPCKRAMYPHASRRTQRDAARSAAEAALIVSRNGRFD